MADTKKDECGIGASSIRKSYTCDAQRFQEFTGIILGPKVMEKLKARGIDTKQKEQLFTWLNQHRFLIEHDPVTKTLTLVSVTRPYDKEGYSIQFISK